MNDHTVIRKKLSTYKSAKGRIRNVPAEVLGEVLHAWETWTGTSKDFYASVGFSHRQMAGVIGKAKKLKREGHFPAEEFQEIQLEGAAPDGVSRAAGSCFGGIELSWSEGKVIRFSQVEQLVDFLKKAA